MSPSTRPWWLVSAALGLAAALAVSLSAAELRIDDRSLLPGLSAPDPPDLAELASRAEGTAQVLVWVAGKLERAGVGRAPSFKKAMSAAAGTGAWPAWDEAGEGTPSGEDGGGGGAGAAGIATRTRPAEVGVDGPGPPAFPSPYQEWWRERRGEISHASGPGWRAFLSQPPHADAVECVALAVVVGGGERGEGGGSGGERRPPGAWPLPLSIAAHAAAAAGDAPWAARALVAVALDGGGAGARLGAAVAAFLGDLPCSLQQAVVLSAKEGAPRPYGLDGRGRGDRQANSDLLAVLSRAATGRFPALRRPPPLGAALRALAEGGLGGQPRGAERRATAALLDGGIDAAWLELRGGTGRTLGALGAALRSLNGAPTRLRHGSREYLAVGTGGAVVRPLPARAPGGLFTLALALAAAEDLAAPVPAARARGAACLLAAALAAGALAPSVCFGSALALTCLVARAASRLLEASPARARVALAGAAVAGHVAAWAASDRVVTGLPISLLAAGSAVLLAGDLGPRLRGVLA